MKIQNTAEKAQGTIPQLWTSAGQPILESEHPSPLTASFLRRCYVHADVAKDIVLPEGYTVMSREQTHIRAQIPFVVTLLVYQSKFQTEPDVREYYVYASSYSPGLAIGATLNLWRRWEKIPATNGDPDAEYPSATVDVSAMNMIDDKEFEDLVKHARKNSTAKFAGDPRDPFAFTVLDSSIRLFKTIDAI